VDWSLIAAQCVMCFRTAAAQQAERSRVLNSGIVILLIPPMAVLAGILILAWRKSGDPATSRTASQYSESPLTPPAKY
jgi:hypothetical protein